MGGYLLRRQRQSWLDWAGERWLKREPEKDRQRKIGGAARTERRGGKMVHRDPGGHIGKQRERVACRFECACGCCGPHCVCPLGVRVEVPPATQKGVCSSWRERWSTKGVSNLQKGDVQSSSSLLARELPRASRMPPNPCLQGPCLRHLVLK